MIFRVGAEMDVIFMEFLQGNYAAMAMSISAHPFTF